MDLELIFHSSQEQPNTISSLIFTHLYNRLKVCFKIGFSFITGCIRYNHTTCYEIRKKKKKKTF